MKVVLKKSWKIQIWPKVMEFWDQSWNFTNPPPPPNCTNFATTKKLSINVESLHFPMFSAKYGEYKSEKRDGHGKSRNGEGKVRKRYFVKFVRMT